MDFETSIRTIHEVILSSKLDTHEGNVTDDVWCKRVTKYKEVITLLQHVLKEQDAINFNPPPLELLILIGGIIGNYDSSGTLHHDEELYLMTNKLLNNLLNICNVESVRSLLFLQPKLPKSCFANMAAQLINKCVSYFYKCSSESKDDPTTLFPLIRDALIWSVVQLDYPELSSEEFISVVQPLGLRLTEDYRPSIQLAGLRLLRHLVSKTRIADWRYTNRALAVLSELFDHRIASTPGSSDSLLDEFFLTLLDLVSLLDQSTSYEWYNKLSERILFDLSMELKKDRQHLLLLHLLKLIKILQSSFALHSRKFTEIISIILLGPRTPSNIQLINNDQIRIEKTVCLLVLECVQEFIGYVWPLVVPYLFPDIIPPLVAFVDLESKNKFSLDLKENEQIKNVLSKIFKIFIKLEPRVLDNVLHPLCDTVPDLNFFL